MGEAIADIPLKSGGEVGNDCRSSAGEYGGVWVEGDCRLRVVKPRGMGRDWVGFAVAARRLGHGCRRTDESSRELSYDLLTSLSF